MEKLFDSVSTDEFIRGLLMASDSNTLGEIFESVVTCDKCLFRKQCHQMSDELEEQGKVTNCRYIISLLLGELKLNEIASVS